MKEIAIIFPDCFPVNTCPYDMDLPTPDTDSGDSVQQVRAGWVEADAPTKYASNVRPLRACYEQNIHINLRGVNPLIGIHSPIPNRK